MNKNKEVKIIKVYSDYNIYDFEGTQNIFIGSKWLTIDSEICKKLEAAIDSANKNKKRKFQYSLVYNCTEEDFIDIYESAEEFIEQEKKRLEKQKQDRLKREESRKRSELNRKKKQLEKLKQELEDEKKDKEKE